MPFVNHQANNPERIRHLLDQHDAAQREFDVARTEGEELSDAEREAMAKMTEISYQLRGLPQPEK